MEAFASMDFPTPALALIAVIILLLLVIALQAIVLMRKSRAEDGTDDGELLMKLATLDEAQQRLEKVTRDDLRAAREAEAVSAKGLREEVASRISSLSETLLNQSSLMTRHQSEQFSAFSQQLRQAATDSADQLRLNQQALLAAVKDIREQTEKHLEAIKADAGSRNS
jgi:hypothetical protein